MLPRVSSVVLGLKAQYNTFFLARGGLLKDATAMTLEAIGETKKNSAQNNVQVFIFNAIAK